ncbi:uncharacterized protein UMAG_10212 [Mycosarcoma maydis]|uniref:Uncharacterized protein n=1 Tax=Mycosarcoma maydis TaxID=5270 RepID=A0A0D1DUY3_MYCMD|nr:uncharacterized protein UMAG_10212 [Ustilago maydis 521]KIS66380.1 hypothetical protein UMAG_10212 [Ustilago maydis 521]|eukprot:XP_011392136.1 hypothetical protein UMAG_10212 [Ustilago maydis 521]
MGAETEQKTQDTDADEYLAFLTLQPLSSPIDGFGSPSVPHPLPPSDRTLRSQSVRTSPRLQLVSSNMLSQGRTTRSGSIIPMGPSTAGLEEVDELDEFDDQLPADLDYRVSIVSVEVCDMLEAESLRMSSRRRDQMTVANSKNVAGSIGGGNGHASVSSHKRPRPTFGGSNRRADVIDLREISPPPSSQPDKRAKKIHGPANADGCINSEHGWDKDVLADSAAVGAALSSELANSAAPRQSQPSLCAIRVETTNGNEAEVIPSTQPLSKHSSSSADTTRSDNDNSNSSDDDVVLVAESQTIKTFGPSANVIAAISKAEQAVAELKETYAGEMARIRVELVERDVLIDGLRARFRKQMSK